MGQLIKCISLLLYFVIFCTANMGKKHAKLSAFGTYLRLGLIIGNFIYGVSIMREPFTLKSSSSSSFTNFIATQVLNKTSGPLMHAG